MINDQIQDNTAVNGVSYFCPPFFAFSLCSYLFN